MENEQEVKAGRKSRFVVRLKAALSEIWVAFKNFSLDAKIVVIVVLALLIAVMFCGGSPDTDKSTRSGNVSAGSILDDAKQNIMEGYQKGLNDIKKDPEIQRDLEEIRKQSEEVGEAAGQLNLHSAVELAG